jgi:ubiquinone/menaquinone biosynthesis C-methylase UbiE
MRLRRALRHLKLAFRALAVPPAAPGHSPHAHHAYSEAELLARAKEFNDNAEKHWRTIAAEEAGRRHALNKPFSNVRDTPAMLYRLGLVLNEMDLGVGMTVLDFGAGSCWVASSINRLRCRTIAVDVSRTALALGEQLFRSDARHHLELEPQFLPYDGHALPLPDASVDRAICFDSFHHVPNQDQLLGELQRVLKPGGRLVLAEPGEGHAHMDQSVYETETFGVLENDLHLDELIAKARRAGFDRFRVKPFPDADSFSFEVERYFEFMGGDDAVYPLEDVRASLRHFFILSMGKGPPRVDSRNPKLLRAAIARAEPAPLTTLAAKKLRFQVRVENTGDTLWLHQVTPTGGYVMLGGHLVDARGAMLQRGFLRAALPRDMPPGDSASLEVELDAPPETGRYTLRLDMVDEYLAWFESCGSKTLELPLDVTGYPDSRDPHRLAAEIVLAGGAPPAAVVPGSALPLSFRLTNTGDSTWLPGAPGERGVVSLGAQLRDARGAVLARDYARIPLPHAVAPRETLALEAAVAAPPETGRFTLHFDLVAEGLCWFEHMGSPPLLLPVETNGETPTSNHPGLLRAAIELSGDRNAAEAAAGADVSLAARVRNAGNTLWRSGEKRRGTVALGGHLHEGERLLELDFLRVPLPRDVAPGETLALQVSFRAPARAGRYLLELDMVDEGIDWFAARGSETARVELLVRPGPPSV